jgi:ubiquitin carboxyl-terminal hydrolase 4/11/15
VAGSYAGLLHEIYDKSPSTVAPRTFKSTLGKFAPMFSGYGQQDSQEFMSFLVDGLHEDLNRVKKKPYRENPDSDDATVHDPEAIRKLGEVFRDNHRARNSSIITDLFNGFYKNKLVCPECSKISITFDPFSLLTLQLPMEHYWEYTFSFFPLNDKPFKIRVDNSKGQTMRDLKTCVASKLPGMDSKRLLLVEIFSHKIYRVMEDRMSIAEANMLANDDMAFYELEDVPTNYPQKQKIRSMLDISPKKDEEKSIDDKQLLTVYHRTSAYQHSKNLGLYPSFITLSKEEASDPIEILRKLLQAVANMTTVDLNEIVAQEAARVQLEEEGNASDSTDELQADDTTETGGNNATENSIKTRSLASDSFVDVSMAGTKEAEDKPNNLPRSTPQYSFLVKGAPIPAPLDKLFEIRVGNTNEIVPSGGYTNSPSNLTGSLPLLLSRLPKPVELATPEESVGSPSPTEASEESTTDEATEKDSDAQMAEDSIDNGSEISFVNNRPGGKGQGKKFQKKKQHQQKKYGKNNNRQYPKQQVNVSRKLSEEPESPAAGTAQLIRPNDFLALDWDQEWQDKLFGTADAEARKNCRTFEDAELENRRQQRESRRKKGVALEDCFAETSKEEILTAENAWYCGNCKERRQASKKLEIWTSPDILVIHLKRFSSGRMFRDKIDVLVDFPVEGLDLTGRVGVDEGKPLLYDLFAVDNHYGGLGGGHYTAYAKNFFDGDWYEYNGEFS